LTSVCAGLVVIDEEQGIIHLVRGHESFDNTMRVGREAACARDSVVDVAQDLKRL